MNTFSVYLSERFKQFEPIRQEIITFLSESGCCHRDRGGDLTVVIGGDGSLLHAIKDNEYRGHYILINSGTLGYYADYDINEVKTFFSDVKRGKKILESHRTLEISDGISSFQAANDIMIGSAVKTLKIKVTLNGESFMNVSASGILLSTPFGSTGYAHSLGGSIMTGDSGYAMNLLAPVHNRIYHTYVTSLILHDDDEVGLIVDNADPFEVATDMIDVSTFSRRFKIKKGSHSFDLCHFNNFDAYKRIKKSFIDD